MKIKHIWNHHLVLVESFPPFSFCFWLVFVSHLENPNETPCWQVSTSIWNCFRFIPRFFRSPFNRSQPTQPPVSSWASRLPSDQATWHLGGLGVLWTPRIHGIGIFTYMNGWFLWVNVGKHTGHVDCLGMFLFLGKFPHLQKNHGLFWLGFWWFLADWYIYFQGLRMLNFRWQESLYRLTAKIIPWNLGPLPELSLLWEIPIYLRVPVLGGWTLDSVPMYT